MTTITNLIVRDIRFPTSDDLDGSDAMNPDPDYSAAYVILETNHSNGNNVYGLLSTTMKYADENEKWFPKTVIFFYFLLII